MKDHITEKALIKVNDNIFSRIKRLLKTIFKRKLKNKQVNAEHKDIILTAGEEKKVFEEKLRYKINDEVQKKLERNRLVQEIEENPELLDLLSNERLEQISHYYDEIIKELEIEIENLKKKC